MLLNNQTINSICILTSGLCNLNCKYCYFNNNNSFKQIDQEIQDGWKNQSYLTNIKLTLNKLKVNFNNIENLTIWGGEPLLNLKNFNNSIKDIFCTFFNISSIWTSTNLKINIQDFVDLLLNIEQYANKEITFKLQISVDGMYQEQGHNLPISFYQQQLEKLITAINNIKFKKLKLIINFHSTITENDFLNKFIDTNEIEKYFQEKINLYNFLDNLIINRNISIMLDIAPTLTFPSTSTTLDGMQFANILQLWDSVKEKYKFKNSLYLSLGQMTEYNYFQPNYECSNLFNSYTILPDGSITLCINSYPNNFKEYQNEIIKLNDTKTLLDLKTELPYSFNPITLSDEELEKKLWLINSLNNNISTHYFFILNLCKEMLEVNQISYIYKDNIDLLIKHILMANNNFGCTFHNLHEAYFPFLIAPSTLRKYLNGVMEYIDSSKILQKTKANKDLIKNEQ